MFLSHQFEHQELTRRYFIRLGVAGARALILLYLMMPKVDGFEFTDALRRREHRRQIPVIVITVKDSMAEDDRRLIGGVKRIIQKGATSQGEVLDLVRSVMQSCAAENI